MQDTSILANLIVFAGVLFVSVSFHEMMHAFVAYKLGDDLAHSRGRISLNPVKHIDPVLTIALPSIMILFGLPPILAAKPVPINPNRISGQELGLAAVGIAGPLTNLLLASIGAVILTLFVFQDNFLYEVVYLFIELNVGLFVFNMLPFPPLDGSRVLYAVAPSWLQEKMEIIERTGIIFSLMILFLLLPFISPLLISANQFISNILIN